VPVESAGVAATLRRLLPDAVEVEILEGDAELSLLPSEAEAVEGAVRKRRAEFSRGRACARRALERLGIEPVAIPVGERRQPLWPDGIVGSITHCSGLTVAAVARSQEVAAIGLDAEPALPLPPETRDIILHPDERSPDDPPREVLVFGAKESTHKALFPMSGVWMDFLDVEVRFHPDGEGFSLRPAPGARSVAPHLTRLAGRCAIAGGFALTVAWLAAPLGDPDTP